jgi:hypothetical protein
MLDSFKVLAQRLVPNDRRPTRRAPGLEWLEGRVVPSGIGTRTLPLFTVPLFVGPSLLGLPGHAALQAGENAAGNGDNSAHEKSSQAAAAGGPDSAKPHGQPEWFGHEQGPYASDHPGNAFGWWDPHQKGPKGSPDGSQSQGNGPNGDPGNGKGPSPDNGPPVGPSNGPDNDPGNGNSQGSGGKSSGKGNSQGDPPGSPPGQSSGNDNSGGSKGGNSTPPGGQGKQGGDSDGGAAATPGQTDSGGGTSALKNSGGGSADADPGSTATMTAPGDDIETQAAMGVARAPQAAISSVEAFGVLPLSPSPWAGIAVSARQTLSTFEQSGAGVASLNSLSPAPGGVDASAHPSPETVANAAFVAGAPSTFVGVATVDSALAMALEPELADLQTAAASANTFDLATDWRDLLRKTGDAGDEVLSAFNTSGPASWLTGTAVLAVAIELVRLQRARQTRRQGPAGGWPELDAPSELA